jgi:hypothetical protein
MSTQPNRALTVHQISLNDLAHRISREKRISLADAQVIAEGQFREFVRHYDPNARPSRPTASPQRQGPQVTRITMRDLTRRYHRAGVPLTQAMLLAEKEFNALKEGMRLAKEERASTTFRRV